jgi:D-alanyl-D-alanine carboxypeptidase/D-alanyl-D-alanine-endopeptidase (penicillin-binding protein 4)
MADPDSTAGVLFLAALRREGIEVGRIRIRFLHPGAAGTAGDGVEAEHRGYTSDDPPSPRAGAWGATASVAPWDSVGADRYRVVATLESPALAHAIAVTAAHSLNMESEALLRLADPSERGKSREAGLRAVMERIEAAGIDTLDLSLVDGSGLSPQNLATPRAVARWLAHLESTPATRGALREGLPEPGKPGTLEERFRAVPAGALLRAKTGSLTNVTALSGYVTTLEGETLVFAMLTNGARRTVSSMRRAEERLVAFLARVPRERGLEVEPPGLPPR